MPRLVPAGWLCGTGTNRLEGFDRSTTRRWIPSTRRIHFCGLLRPLTVCHLRDSARREFLYTTESPPRSLLHFLDVAIAHSLHRDRFPATSISPAAFVPREQHLLNRFYIPTKSSERSLLSIAEAGAACVDIVSTLCAVRDSDNPILRRHLCQSTTANNDRSGARHRTLSVLRPQACFERILYHTFWHRLFCFAFGPVILQPQSSCCHFQHSIPVAFVNTLDKHDATMVYQHNNGSSTLPRGFRFHDHPRTPEPMDADEPQQPSPPRPARLKVRRRNPSSLQAPTDQFLASVAAADVPIPTIEEPQFSEDSEMVDSGSLSIQTSGFLAPTNSFRLSSPPKTPMPELSTEDGSHRPDWSANTFSPPCDYFQRPMSALSNSSGFSDDSFYSGSRVSHRSEDGSCTSPESDIADPFVFPSMSKAKGKERAVHLEEAAQHAPHLNAQLRSKTRKDAPWTKAQSAHLWSTYLLYLQDPTVTPFRIGASAVPPQGIIIRVAREAKRSWKGPKLPTSTSNARRSARLNSVPRESFDKSGSITPTAETPKVYAQWPHSSSATRAHLRDLCKSKSKSSNPVQLHHHLQSRSPTPFSKPYRSLFEISEAPRLTSFSTSDIALSLATSTSESMQPDGPLAKLSADQSEDTRTTIHTLPEEFGLERYKQLGLDESQGRRLGSPFSRTYGPSSSKSILSSYRPSASRTRSDNTEPFLGSPVRFDEPRSLNGTTKRRAQHSLEEELSPSGAVLRPSILDEQLFGGRIPLLGSQRRVRSRGFSLGDEALRHRVPGVFQPTAIVPEVSAAHHLPNPTDTAAAPILLPSAEFDPPRLGSPFCESGPSKTFPRRLFQDGSATIRRSAFATMHQTRRSIESFDFGEGLSLQSRLSHLDDKLKEIRDREAAAKRHNN